MVHTMKYLQIGWKRGATEYPLVVNLISPDQNIKPFETTPPETAISGKVRRTVKDLLEGFAHSRRDVTCNPWVVVT